MHPPQDDRIFRSTRLVSAIVLPFLLLAFVILYLFPQRSGSWFAWQIEPRLTAAYMASGYLGGGYLFLHALLGREWHRVAAAFPSVSAFTASMLLATLLHWARFDVNHLPFQVWLLLYAITPVLMPWLWWRNRVTDPGSRDSGQPRVPRALRRTMQGAGALLLLAALAGMVAPALFIAVWPWTLTPLTARVLAGWVALLGVGNLAIGSEPRWSAWRVGSQSIALWHGLFLLRALTLRDEFQGGLLNNALLGTLALLLAIAALHGWMARAERQAPPTAHPG